MFGDIENNQKGYPIKQINEFSDLFAGATPSTKVSAYWKNGTRALFQCCQENKCDRS